MGYDDRYYYGQCKLIVQTNAGKVSVISKEGHWEANTVMGKAEFMIPGRDLYTIIAGDDFKTIEVGYGKYKRVRIGD